MAQLESGWAQYRFPEWWAKLSSMDKRSGQRPKLVAQESQGG